MESKPLSTGKHRVEMEDGEDFAANQLGGEVKLADIVWVKIHEGSWWPAQVVDDNIMSRNNKLIKRSADKVLVWLYGSYKYSYVDPLKYRSEFDIILKHNNGCYREILLKALERILKHNNGCYREILLKALERDVSCSKSNRSKKQGSKSKEIVAVDASRRMSSRIHARQNQQTESSNLVRVSPRRQRNGIIPQSKVESRRFEQANSKAFKLDGAKPNKLISKEEEEKRKSFREDGVQKKLKRNGPTDQAEVLSKSQKVSARRLKVMQHLGLISPSGSPFYKNGLI